MHHLPEIKEITTPRVKNVELPFKSSLTYKFIYIIAIQFLIYDLTLYPLYSHTQK